MLLLRCTQPLEQRADLLLGPSLGRSLPADQPVSLKAAQDAAEITGIEVKLARNVACRRTPALLDLVQHPCLGERIGAVEPAALQDAEPLGVEAIEAAHRR